MKKVCSAVVPIITVDRRLPRPLQRQVYEACRAAIVDGTWHAGQRVPSTRVLAAELGISRIPVLNAYAQLIAEGYFQSRIGAGTVVSSSLPGKTTPWQPGALRETKPTARHHQLEKPFALPQTVERGTWQRARGAFCVGQVPYEEFPVRTWNRLVTRNCRNLSANALNYADPMGSRDLRQAVAVYLRTARGVRCDVEQIMIVNGSQHALEITARALLSSGDPVWMEEPGYSFARSIFSLHRCRVVPVPVDAEGLNVRLGVKACRKARAALVTPSHQYPLGVTMTASRRLQLLDWAEQSQAWIIEDDYDSEYRYDSMPIASLQGLDRDSRVVYVGTFSKVVFPSLRLGYLVVPPDLVDHFLAVRFAMDIGSAAFYQEVLADFIREGHFSRHIRRMRSLYGERRSVLMESIRSDLGPKVEITGAQAGMHLTIALNEICDREISHQAARQNLWLVPLSPSYAGSEPKQGFILGFGSTATKEIPTAVRALRALLGATARIVRPSPASLRAAQTAVRREPVIQR
jgi:GntR family transcriptional regulator/MocR family aminotransferase